MINHLPALYVILPLFGALSAAISYNIKVARFIAIAAITSNFTLSLYGLASPDNIRYAFGNWQAPIGIEYSLDALNKPLIVYINGILLFILLFCNRLIKELVLKHIVPKYQHLFYAILLFAHTGYLGMTATNDLFNLYVFIEISSLTSYVLISLGNHPKAAIGAFDYLILGSIGACLILIAIGLLFAITGSLNITDIKAILMRNDLQNLKIARTAAAFFISGSLLKIAFFPMHFWMLRAYNYASAIVLVYLSAISGIIGIYITLRFIHFVLDYEQIKNTLSIAFVPVSYLAIVICSILAVRAKTLRNILIYSAGLNIGYIIFFLVSANGYNILFPLLLADSINKTGLFLITAYYDSNKLRLVLYNKYLIAIIIICSTGLPISAMFMLKINMLTLLINQHKLLSFTVFVCSFCLSLIYHYKIISILYVTNKAEVIKPRIVAYDLITIIIIQFSILLYFNNIIKYSSIIIDPSHSSTKQVLFNVDEWVIINTYNHPENNHSHPDYPLSHLDYPLSHPEFISGSKINHTSITNDCDYYVTKEILKQVQDDLRGNQDDCGYSQDDLRGNQDDTNNVILNLYAIVATKLMKVAL